MSLPTAPSRTMDQDTFDATTDAFVGALPQFEVDMNALAAAMTLNSTTDTSTSSVLIGTGSKTFTVSASKSFWPGMWLVIADTAAPTTNAMYVQVTSYSGTTLIVNSVGVQGSGTIASWQISQTVRVDGAVFTSPVDTTATTLSVAAATADAHAVKYTQVINVNHAMSAPTRAKDTAYQNITTAPIIAYISAKNNTSGGYCFAVVGTAAEVAAPALGSAFQVGFISQPDATVHTQTISFIIPPGAWYKLLSGGGVTTIDHWNELSL